MALSETITYRSCHYFHHLSKSTMVVTNATGPGSSSQHLPNYPQEALVSAKWIYSNAQRTANYTFRRSLELISDANPFVLNKDIPEPGRSDEQTIHLRAYYQHQETIKNFKKDLWVAYGHPQALDTEIWQRLKEAEGDERKKIEETWEALEWITHSYLEEGCFDGLGYSAPWEHLHSDSPGPFLSLGTHFWALIIANDNYPDAPGLGGCINDAHLVNDYLAKYLQVSKDHIVLLENACRNEMIDALYNLRDNGKILFGDNILIYYSGYGSSYNSGTLIQGQWSQYIGAICPVDRGCSGSGDISERELDVILSELSTTKGPKITFISDCCYEDSGIRSDQEKTGAAFRVAPSLPDDEAAMIHMLKLGMDNPRRHSNIDIFSENWKRDLTSFVQLSPGHSTIEVDAGLGKGRHGLFTLAVIKVLESEEGRDMTYEGVIQIIGRLRNDQIPEAVGTGKASLLWFRDTAHLDGQEESNSTSM